MGQIVFTIITPSRRHKSALALCASIAEMEVPDGVSLQWQMIFNPHTPPLTDEQFYVLYNDTVRRFSGDYFLFASDDTLMHPRLLTAWNESRLFHLNAGMWMIGQKTRGGARPVDMHSFHHGELDNGQAIISREFFASCGVEYYSLGWERYLFRKLYEIAPERVQFIPELLCLHDAQGW